MRPVRPDRERGAALLTVLLLVAVIAVLAASALERLRLSTRLTANAGALDAARGYAYAAETLATTRITALLRQAGGRVTLAGGWSGRPFGLPVPGGVATARVVDGGNCLNLNGLVGRGPDGALVAAPEAVLRFERLLTLLQVPGRANEIAAATADYIDSDMAALPGGAEDEAYLGATPPRRTANTLMADASELRAVTGVTPETWRIVAPWVCALPVPQQSVLNVNTLAPEQAPLVASLLPDPAASVAQVEGALLRRPETGFGSADQFWTALSLAGGTAAGPGATSGVGGDTRWFALRVDVAQADIELHERALIDARTLPVRLVARQWGEQP